MDARQDIRRLLRETDDGFSTARDIASRINSVLSFGPVYDVETTAITINPPVFRVSVPDTVVLLRFDETPAGDPVLVFDPGDPDVQPEHAYLSGPAPLEARWDDRTSFDVNISFIRMLHRLGSDFVEGSATSAQRRMASIWTRLRSRTDLSISTHVIDDSDDSVSALFYLPQRPDIAIRANFYDGGIVAVGAEVGNSETGLFSSATPDDEFSERADPWWDRIVSEIESAMAALQSRSEEPDSVAGFHRMLSEAGLTGYSIDAERASDGSVRFVASRVLDDGASMTRIELRVDFEAGRARLVLRAPMSDPVSSEIEFRPVEDVEALFEEPSFTDAVVSLLHRFPDEDEDEDEEPEPEIDWKEIDPLAIEIEEVPPDSGRWDPRTDPYAVEIEDVDES